MNWNWWELEEFNNTQSNYDSIPLLNGMNDIYQYNLLYTFLGGLKMMMKIVQNICFWLINTKKKYIYIYIYEINYFWKSELLLKNSEQLRYVKLGGYITCPKI